jgi:hypothetical protein
LLAHYGISRLLDWLESESPFVANAACTLRAHWVAMTGKGLAPR